ncbi:LysR family transcriptional regulator [Granulosicoccus sp. 3-233]|uniref:LysR family transcriptional regulator n=1 Tax=Granulosicoccus sp. 3-233 TaxID=3417969 RepID=UPI003D32B83A
MTDKRYKPLGGLQQFQAVYKTRNLTTAAQALGISQPALTQAITKLEKLLGVELFDRSTRPLGVTRYGELLVEHANTIERSNTELHKSLEALKSGSGGLLRVGCGPDWIHDILPRAICAQQQRNPDLRFELTVALNNELHRMLDRDAIDCYFSSISDDFMGTGYSTQILVQERMTVIARHDHPIHREQPRKLKDIADQRWAMTGEETFGRDLMKRLFGDEKVDLPIPMIETNSVSAMINIVRYSNTLGFLSQTHLNAYPDIRAVSMEKALPERLGGVTLRTDQEPMAAVVELLDEVRGVIDSIRVD